MYSHHVLIFCINYQLSLYNIELYNIKLKISKIILMMFFEVFLFCMNSIIVCPMEFKSCVLIFFSVLVLNEFEFVFN